MILSGNGNASGPDYTERIPSLDDVMLYRRALSAGEIARLRGRADRLGRRRDRDAGGQ